MKIKIESFLIITFLIICLFFLSCLNYLEVCDKQGKVLKSFRVSPGDYFIVSFIHSSELEPWDNLFLIERNKTFSLKEIHVPSTGPGVPSVLEEGWKLKIDDGFFIYQVGNRNYDYIDFIVSKISPHHLKIKNQDINLVELAGDWASITIRIRKSIIPY